MNSASSFITNQDKLLKDVISNILPASREASFLVGYFYFSGFYLLKDQLKDKLVKLLIGMDIERELGGVLKEYAIMREDAPSLPSSNLTLRDKMHESLVAASGYTDFIDTPEKEEAFRLFLKKISDNTLEIRKTKESNHAKLYIFENDESHSQGGELPGTVITGSSNLTAAGLERQFEINVISHDARDYKEAKRLFDELWERHSVPIADALTKDEFSKKVVERIWFGKLPAPYLIYARVLLEYFPLNKDKKIQLPQAITKERYINLEYQTDAIYETLTTLKRHDGAIIADVVGLGKSIIASAVAYNLGLATIVIAPPHLEDQWKGYSRSFQFHGEVYGSSSIHKALADYADHKEQKLIIIDEAHRYRNELTRDYARLHQLCQNNKVLLLTATPFNNTPKDIFALVKLFQVPGKSTIRTVKNLSEQFKTLMRQYKQARKLKDAPEKQKLEIQSITEQLHGFLDPVVIRRSRKDLETIQKYQRDLDKQNIAFPEVVPPRLLRYEFGNLEDLYIRTAEKIIGKEGKRDGLTCARYQPVNYLKNRQKYTDEITRIFGDATFFKRAQTNLAKFMRRLLVRRFESSIPAFQNTLSSMTRSMERIQKYAEKAKQVPISKKGDIPDIESIMEGAGDYKQEEIDEKLEDLAQETGIWFLPAKELKKSYFTDLQKDIQLLREIQSEWFGKKAPHQDPKCISIIQKIKQELEEDHNRKIVVFTEFADTAEYFYAQLAKHIPCFLYTSARASEQNRIIVRNEFDAGLPLSKQTNNYRVLVATDALSEGFNLHRAGIVINYDIPYNPTRVIQRVGRINRINKKMFDKLYIYNAFPSYIGEEITRIKRISTFKIEMIHALLGSDAQVLTDEENIEAFYQKKYKEEASKEEQESWDTPFKNELDHIPENVKKQAWDIPPRVRIQRTKKRGENGVALFAKKGEDYVFLWGDKPFSDEQSIAALAPKRVLELFKAELNERASAVSAQFDSVYQAIKRAFFVKGAASEKTRGEREVIQKIALLRERVPREEAYLEDLYRSAAELEALTERHGKFIRSEEIDADNPSAAVALIKKEIPPEYLASIIAKANRVEGGEEVIIVAEEF